MRFQQVHQGIPVRGGEIIVHLRGASATAVTAKTLPDIDKVDTVPVVTPVQALDVAKEVLAKELHVTDATLSKPRLEIFNEGLLSNRQTPTFLAWFIEATKPDVREYIWIDAKRGAVLLHFSMITDAKSRKIYDTNSTNVLPGTLVRNEGGAATADSDVNGAYVYSGDTYDYYFNQHGRDSYDGLGSTIISTVDFCDPARPCPYQNAFWNGAQMVYGVGFSQADDVVAHELTHAVTERSARLIYFMQSGALNESFSDIFGETVDLSNTGGTDTAAVRWLAGENLPGGAIRSMKDPTLFGHPGKVSDPQYHCNDTFGEANDNGGVHSNSGVPNHAYALMVDGGTYNGQTVIGIGLTKAGKIQYRALTSYLVSTSDFQADYTALQQACSDLIGTAGITVGDCSQVKKALDAVEMNITTCSPPDIPAFCPAGQGPTDVFADDLENNASGKWLNSFLSNGINHWSGCDGVPNIYCPGFTASGRYSFWGSDSGRAGDSKVLMSSPVALPAGSRLQFNHFYSFGNDGTTFFDGGVIEYSLNGLRGNWIDAGSLINAGAVYGGIINGAGNPLKSRNAFVGDSLGYTASQLDLSSLSGNNVLFRFRMGTGLVGSDTGWFVDDVRIYTCSPININISDVSQVETRLVTTEFTFTVTLDKPASTTVTVDYATTDGSARISDYVAATGKVIFAPGETSKTVVVNVFGDVAIEPNETFVINLSNAAGATINDGQAIGTILNDDFVAWSGRDFESDLKAELAVWRPGLNGWRALYSSSGYTQQLTLSIGGTGSIPVLGDFDGDARADVAVWSSSTGLWLVLKSSSILYTETMQKLWGSPSQGDLPLPGDYDGDGITDMAVWRAGTGIWYVLKSSSNFTTSFTKKLGNRALHDVAVTGDYDSDGITDFAVWNPGTGIWQIATSSSRFTQVTKKRWGSGMLKDIPVPGDYDGDGTTDLAVWRPETGEWLVSNSGSNFTTSFTKAWGSGTANDIPVPGDFDGDRKFDLATWNLDSGIWNVSLSNGNFTNTLTKQFGNKAQGDVVLVDQLAILRQLKLQ
ncbi:MAG: M4 family metallopeptidase [Methylococcaceae bacterium]|nr:M4 family metallopeptidase [Methylococcaceae bacterium]